VLLAEVTAMVGQRADHGARHLPRRRPGRGVRRGVQDRPRRVTYAVLVMIYLGFLLASRAGFSKKMDQLYDTEHHREQARRVFNSIRNAVEDYVRLVTFKALLIAVVAFAVMMVLGVHAALFVAFLVFLAAFIPIVGAFAGALIPALVALAQFGDPTKPGIILAASGSRCS
jgi:AI-2 transport protein TqsA